MIGAFLNIELIFYHAYLKFFAFIYKAKHIYRHWKVSFLVIILQAKNIRFHIHFKRCGLTMRLQKRKSERFILGNSYQSTLYGKLLILKTTTTEQQIQTKTSRLESNFLIIMHDKPKSNQHIYYDIRRW